MVKLLLQVKNRWAGKTIVDLFAEEFKGRPYEYYWIQVDGEMVPVSYVVKSSQRISHFVHRHEPPVMACEVPVLQKDPDVLTVHPCGQYCKNTVVSILNAEHGLAPLFPVHWLDRLDSGLLILARNAAKADIFRQQIEAGLVHKQHIAKVAGEFPEDETIMHEKEGAQQRRGLCFLLLLRSWVRDSTKGKAASTKFTWIITNGTQSIVLCEPITGRTHLIHVHLQYSGHPVANNMLYISEQTFGRSVKGLRADRSARISDVYLTSNFTEIVPIECEENSNGDFSIDPMCTNCPNLAPKGYDGDEEGLWLHCIRYSGPGGRMSVHIMIGQNLARQLDIFFIRHFKQIYNGTLSEISLSFAG